MAWEEDYRHVNACFCGKGKLISVGRSNDWNQSESSEYLECEECKKEYIYVFCDPYSAARKKTDGYAWWKKDEWEAEKSRRHAYEQEQARKEAIAQLDRASQRPVPDAQMKNKEIYSILTFVFKWIPSQRMRTKQNMLDIYAQRIKRAKELAGDTTIQEQ